MSTTHHIIEKGSQDEYYQKGHKHIWIKVHLREHSPETDLRSPANQQY